MKTEKRRVLKGLAFISPWILGFLVFQLYPVTACVYYSFCYYDVLRPPAFIGAENYLNLIADEVFRDSLVATLKYAVMALPMGLFTSLFFAILLNQKIIGRSIFRTIYFLPSLVPTVALAILWSWIFRGDTGILNHGIEILLSGFDYVMVAGCWLLREGFGQTELVWARPEWMHPPNWLGSVRWATPAVVMTGVWGVGGSIVIYLASLQDVPRHLYEAAEIDGATWWGKTWHITLPMISPVIFFNLIMGVIGCLQVFVQPLIMTNGGPARATYYYTLYLFDNAFVFLKMGYASAMALILFAIIFVLTLVTAKFASKKVYYAD